MLFEVFAPFLVCLSLLPLVVKARVQHAYAHTKKTDKVESTPQVTPRGQRGKKGKVSFTNTVESVKDQKAKKPEIQTEFVGNM